MPTLNWIGKSAVEKHHKEVPFRLLEPVEELSFGDTDSGNLIVQGDNLHALKALLPRYAGQVKCIYIDPPYNTGNENWVYNDNVNSPEIRKWLGSVVGKEGETLDRHDRWLCMMYPRLLLLKQFLKNDGAIFISIDDNEVASLRLLMDEIFGSNNYVTTIVWQKIFTIKNSARHFSEMHDYVLVYALNKKIWERNLLPRSSDTDEDYSNIDNDPRGVWTTNALQSRNYYSKGTYKINCPNGNTISGPPKGTYWRMSECKLQELDKDDRVWWGKDRGSSPRIKKFLSEAKKGVVPSTWWKHDFAGTNSGAKTELRSILGDFEEELFNTPKPWQLIQRIIQISTDEDSIVLDSFAGSGATAHAVLDLNKKNNGNRKFILVEMDNEVSKNITSKRVRNIVLGYPFKGKKRDELYVHDITFSNLKEIPEILNEIESVIDLNSRKYTKIIKKLSDNKISILGETHYEEKFLGLGSGFQFLKLSNEELFNSDGMIRESVSYEELAEFIWFMETGTGLKYSNLKENGGKCNTPYLGKYKGRSVFLLYNGILKDRSDIGGNVLNGRSLKILNEILPEFDGPKIVYGARSRFDKTKLAKIGITFHQLPYELAVKTWF